MVLSREEWATIGPGTGRARLLRESESNAGCNQGSPAMVANIMTYFEWFLLGGLQDVQKNIVHATTCQYLSIEGGERRIITVRRDAKGVGGG